MNDTTKTLIYASVGALGVFTFANAIRKHYKRLSKQSVRSTPILDNSKQHQEEVVEKKTIPEDLLEKMVEKIKNSTIHTICIYLDRLNNQKGFIKKDKELQLSSVNNDDILIQEDQTQDKSENLPKEELTEEKKNEAVELISMLNAKSNFLQDFEKEIFSYHSFSTQISSQHEIFAHLCMKEKEIINSFKYSVEDYKKHLQIYMKTNKKIKSYVTILNLFVQSLDSKELFMIEFDKAISENYIKIITNIYHLNLTRTYSKYAENPNVEPNIIKAKNGNEQARYTLTQIFNEIYKNELDKTRDEIIQFFGLKKHSLFEIPIKILLRIYPLYLDSNGEVRKKYKQVTDNVNNIINRLELKEEMNEFIDQSDPNYSNKPEDKEFDFSSCLKEENIHEEEEREREKRELFNKYLENYGVKKEEAD